MSRYKPRGWRGDSYRHYLAAKGVKTKVKKSAPKFKKAFVTSLNPRELIIPSSKQEQEWAEGLFTLFTGKEPKRGTNNE